MRILTFNVRHGGGTRVDRICETVRGHDADVVVLTEFRQGRPGDRLRQSLRECGWHHQESSNPPPRSNGLLVASRLGFTAMPGPVVVPEGSWRWLECKFDSFAVVGVYFPLGRPKIPHWEWFLRRALVRASRPYVLIGDFNTGKHGIDETGATFVGPQYIEKLEQMGFVDAWRHFHRDEREYTWFSRTNNGFRLDYAFVSPLLFGRLQSARHSHAERDGRVSDHAALIVEFDEAILTERVPGMNPKPTVVHSDPKILSGTPVFVGTRVPVQSLFDYLEGGDTLDEFLRQFPSVKREQAIATLEFARDSVLTSARTA